MNNSKFTVKIRNIINELRFVPDIFDQKGQIVFNNVSSFLSQIRSIESADRRINEIKKYPNNEGFRDGTGGEEVDLLDDHIIRNHNGDPNILEFFNDNLENPEVEIISKSDLIDIFEQWKLILLESRGNRQR